MRQGVLIDDEKTWLNLLWFSVTVYTLVLLVVYIGTFSFICHTSLLMFLFHRCLVAFFFVPS